MYVSISVFLAVLVTHYSCEHINLQCSVVSVRVIGAPKVLQPSSCLSGKFQYFLLLLIVSYYASGFSFRVS